MKKQIVVVGLGRLGVPLATTLFSLGHEVLALDVEEKNVQAVAHEITHAVQADATDEAVLRNLGIGNFDIAIVTTSDVESSVLTTILLKKVGVPYVIARADSELHGSILQKIGADKIFYPEREMGVMIAHVLTVGDVIDYIPVAPSYGVNKLMAPTYFVGRTLSELGFGPNGKWEIAVLLIQRKQEVMVSPSDAEVVREGDALIVAGSWDKLEELFTQAKGAR